MVSTYSELNKSWNFPSEITDLCELQNFDTFINDFTNNKEYNHCLDLKVDDKIYKGSDKEFEEILLLFPNHKFNKENTPEPYASIMTYYEGFLEDKEDDYFILEYMGGWLSRFDLTFIILKGNKEAWELIKNKYSLN